MDNVQKVIHAVSAMSQRLATDARLMEPKEIRRPRLTERERYPQKVQAINEKALQTKRAEFRADVEHVITRQIVIGTLPCVKITSLRQDAHMATNALFDVLRRRESTAKIQRKVVRKDQLQN